MPTFVLMTKLGAEVMTDPRGRKIVGKEWKKRVNARNVKRQRRKRGPRLKPKSKGNDRH